MFSAGRVELTLSEIARLARLPLTTAHRIVGELVGWGALERTKWGTYHVGLRLWEVSALAPRGHGLREIATPFLEDLYEATRQNVQLAVLDGVDVVYVERIAPATRSLPAGESVTAACHRCRPGPVGVLRRRVPGAAAGGPDAPAPVLREDGHLAGRAAARDR